MIGHVLSCRPDAGPGLPLKLTSVLLDEIVNAGVLRHIANGIGHHAINRIGDILVRGLKCAFNRVAGTIVFGHLVAVGVGDDNGDIGFGGDVVTHVTLRNVGVQFIDDDLQVNGAVRTNHIATRGHLFFKDFLQ